jgi:hypothetical protein
MSFPRANGFCAVVNKLCYTNEETAHEALAVIRSRGRRPEVRAYPCPWCAKWHLSSKAEAMLP